MYQGFFSLQMVSGIWEAMFLIIIYNETKVINRRDGTDGVFLIICYFSNDVSGHDISNDMSNKPADNEI